MDLVDVLHNEFQKRRAKNSRYSLRAFAQQIGLQSATLSAVLKRKRALPEPQALRLMTDLKLTHQQKKLVIKSMKTPLKQSSLKEFWERPQIAIEKATAAVISEWEYAAVMSLCRVKDFKPEAKWIAERLGIELSRGEQVWSTLRSLRLIEISSAGEVSVCWENLLASSPIPSKLLRQAHMQELDLAREKLETVPMQQRIFSSLTFAMNSKKMSEANDLIRQFLLQMESTLERGSADQVFQLGVQLYPLTKSEAILE
ncbi:MAG: DUF4423 domain-containing protein [Pseudobdellovibrionaceae bacterium]